MRILVKRVDTVFQEVTGVEIIAGRPLEQFTSSLPNDEVVVGGSTKVARLADVADPGVLLQVAAADSGGVVGRGVVRNDQLEILVALAKQGIRDSAR